VRLDLDIDPDPFRAAGPVAALSEAITGKIQDRVLPRVAALYAQHEERHLDSEGKATGPRFAPLSDSRRARKSPGDLILEDTGKLRRGLIKTRVNARGMFGGLTRGKRAKIAAIHNHGTGKLPSRPTFRADLSIKGGETSGTRVPLGAAILQVHLAEIVRANDKSRTQVLQPFGFGRITSDPSRFRTR